MERELMLPTNLCGFDFSCDCDRLRYTPVTAIDAMFCSCHSIMNCLIRPTAVLLITAAHTYV